MFSFAEDGTDRIRSLNDAGQNSVTATTDGMPQPRRSCFSRGSATLTQVSGKNLYIFAEAFAYHDVDRIGFTVYLEKSKNNTITTVKSWSASAYNDKYVELNKTYTVDEAANYRLNVIFSTKHTADGTGTEGGSATTDWLWIE